jgi:hypothetical protein
MCQQCNVLLTPPACPSLSSRIAIGQLIHFGSATHTAPFVRINCDRCGQARGASLALLLAAS